MQHVCFCHQREEVQASPKSLLTESCSKLGLLKVEPHLHQQPQANENMSGGNAPFILTLYSMEKTELYSAWVVFHSEYTGLLCRQNRKGYSAYKNENAC